MKIETYLNAYALASSYMDDDTRLDNYQRICRQYHAFRARILRMFVANWRLPWEAAEKRAGELEHQLKSERDLHELTVAEKDAEIEELEVQISILHGVIDRR